MPERNRSRALDALVIILVAVVAAALCAYRLSTRSLWLDEGASVSIASQHGAALWRGIAHDGGNMLVYYLALHWMIGLFGHGLVSLRILSLIADAATAGLTALIALRLFSSRPVALLSGVLSGVSVGLVFWGQDARGYAWMVTAVAASFYCLIRLLDEDRVRLWPALGGYVFFTALALYIGYDAVLVVPAQLLACVMLRRGLGPALLGVAAVLVLSIPLIVLAVERGSGQLFWVPSISWGLAWQSLETLVSSGLPPNFHTTAVTVIGGVLGAGVGVWALLAAWRARHGEGRAELVSVPALWLAVPLVIAVLAYLAGEPVELARITILMMPAVSLLTAWLLVGPREPPVATARDQVVACAPRLGRGSLAGVAVAAGLVVVVLGLRVWALVPSYSETPEPWKQVVRVVLAGAQPGDCVAFYPWDGREPFGYYVDTTSDAIARAPRSVFPRQAWNVLRPRVEQYPVPSSAQLAARTRGCGRVWLIASHQGQRFGPPQSRRNYAGYLTVRRELEARLGPASVTRRFGWASTIDVTLYGSTVTYRPGPSFPPASPSGRAG